MKKILFSCMLIATIFSLNGRNCRPANSCALERGQQAYTCIKQGTDPWYYGMPQNWAAPGEWFAGPMNRKYYGGYNAFPSPGYGKGWVGAQW